MDVLFINGEAVKKERIEDYVDNKSGGEGDGHPIQQYEETLPNGVKYRVLDQLPNGSADNTIEYVVPPAHYFMMGDNRDNSETRGSSTRWAMCPSRTTWDGRTSSSFRFFAAQPFGKFGSGLSKFAGAVS